MIPNPNFYALQEDPINFENAILDLNRRAFYDTELQTILEGIYCEEDRESAFSRFYQGLEYQIICSLLKKYKVDTSTSICEIGGGPGYLAWALYKSGYVNIDLLEPNGEWISGTGYLSSREDAAGIHIENDLDHWYKDDRQYSLLITRNVIHHFQGIPYILACARQKLRPNGLWMVIREQYAENSQELYKLLIDHPLSLKYNIYEFAYPVQYIIDSFALAGFDLVSLVPNRYGNGALSSYVTNEGSLKNRLFTKWVNKLLDYDLKLPTYFYNMEKYLVKPLRKRFSLFTKPQMMLFRRSEKI